MIFAAAMNGPAHHTLAGWLAVGVTSLLLYVPVTLTLEEVSFRGAFDAHVPGALGQKPLPMLIVGLLGVHCAVGVPLSFCWRRSGNLFVTGATHALVDAVRNALVVLPHL
jgi:membrane protease YdiL (CAAX protease family)